MNQAHLELAHMTRDEVASYAPASILVLVTAATEQHGPHLPLGTDMLIGEAVARAALSRLSTGTPFVLAPVMPYGSSHHHLIYSALSLATTTFLAGVMDLLESALVSGFRRMYVINSHGGNVECVRLAARDTALSHSAIVGSCSYWDVSRPAIEAAGLGYTGPVPGHAGQFETSLMLAIAPALVKADRIPPGKHHRPKEAAVATHGSVVQAHGDWARTGGVTDAPNHPSAELGRALLDLIGERVAAALNEFDALSRRRVTEET